MKTLSYLKFIKFKEALDLKLIEKRTILSLLANFCLLVSYQLLLG